MCGIALIIDRSGKEVGQAEIDRLTDLLSHRGPDGRGTFREGNLALGHRRLSILDLSEAGAQPMHSGDELVVVFNGEIYNYLEIRTELAKAGIEFSSATDTEVLLQAYRKWGSDCLQRFNGMFSFAIYDRRKRELFCARDRFGIKPFYYRELDGKILIGSEARQLLAYGGSAQAEMSVLADYLLLGYEDHDERTAFEGIRQLLPGHCLQIGLDRAEIHPRRWYELNADPEVSRMDETAALEAFSQRLNASIKLRLRSDVQVGSCLSGGLDSSSIVALSAAPYKQEAGRPMQTVHAASTQADQDESDYARMVAEYCGAGLTVIRPGSTDFAEIMDELIRIQGQPVGSMSVAMQYLVMKKAREIGNIVMLDGQGGDESLLGYERYFPLVMGKGNPLSNALALSANSKLSFWKVLAFTAYFRIPSLRIARQKKAWSFLSPAFVEQAGFGRVRESAASYRSLTDLQRLELSSLQLPHLLRYEDRNSMAHGVESRLPLLDHKVVEASLALPASLKIRDGWSKYALRKTVEGRLPDEVVWRKNKIGFESPMESWFRTVDLNPGIRSSELMKVMLNDPSGQDWNAIPLKQRWRLFNLMRWEAAYF